MGSGCLFLIEEDEDIDMLRKTGVLLLVLFSMNAQALQVVTSIKPLQLIVLELTKNVTHPQALLPASASPHDYALRPSDIKMLNQADMVVWFGASLEPYMEKVVGELPSSVKISTMKGVDLIDHGKGHQHGDHYHASTDVHVWLGIKQSMQIAKQVTQQLIAIDPQRSDIYQQNLTDFISEMKALDEKIISKLAPVKDRGFYVFHDAYAYFVQAYGLNQLGYFTVSPERKPGAKTLIKIKKSLAKDDVYCVFKEPQFTPAVIQTVTRGADVPVGELDPLATKALVQSGGYHDFLLELTQSFVDCLGNNTNSSKN